MKASDLRPGFPFTNQADLLTAGPRLVYQPRWFDDEGYERTERRNGAYQCPKCGLWWPVIEEPDCWTEIAQDQDKWAADSWWGGAHCEHCDLLMIDQPDGRGECYQLGNVSSVEIEGGAPNAEVKRQILLQLDDYQRQDWDDALIAVEEAFSRVQMKTGPRQVEQCLAELVDAGEVIERWSRGGFATLQRVKIEKVNETQGELF